MAKVQSKSHRRKKKKRAESKNTFAATECTHMWSKTTRKKKTVNKLKEAARKSEINAFRCKLHKQPQSKRKKSTLEKKTLPS
jgi:hypothetical protein